MTFPLTGIRVLDLTDGLGESCGRYLADLGAEVVRAEPPGGTRSRSAEPRVGGVSIPFALRNANKRGITLDPDRPEHLRELVRGVDIVVDSGTMGADSRAALDLAADPSPTVADLLAENPALVWVSITPFGRTGPYRDWTASESVLYAMSGVLSRSGTPGAAPLLPPAGLIEETVGVHAAWSALLAHVAALGSGRGEFVDLSAFETVVHGFDPGFGTQGSAAAGRSEDFPRGRPAAANFYPVFRCADGYVRICLLARRQWRSMFEWLGAPAEFADPKYDTIPARFAAADRLHPLIGALFAERTRDELVAEGARRGVPLGGVHDVAEVLRLEHFAASGALTDMELAPGLSARVPAGYLNIDGVRAGIRTPAPGVGERDGQPGGAPAEAAAAADQARHSGAYSVVNGAASPSGAGTTTGAVVAADPVRPLAGLRVLDLGVIVFGAELSRQLADYGADVIKIENAAFPDGLRQAKRGAALAPSVAWGHRNKRSFGVDLRTGEGRRIFTELVRDADVLLANFKPGTLTSMGFDPAELSALNPRLIVSDASAFGNVGPWRERLGYGPLVRASCGVSAMWRYPDDPELLCDGMTVYPDHIAGQVAATAILAALIRRVDTGVGGLIELAQSDTALVQLGVQLAAESIVPGSAAAPGNRDPYYAPTGVFPCAGDDEWCVVAVRTDAEWARLCEVVGRPEPAADPMFATREGRLAHRSAAEDRLIHWLAGRSPREAMATLQAAGVPAGAMLRLPELLRDPQLRERGAYAVLAHPLLPADLPATATVAHFDTIPAPPLRPAPLPGEHTEQICRTLLGMSDETIAALVEQGVLQVLPPGSRPAAPSLPRPVGTVATG
ncbi:CaiB/BaiF CoA transferase family protein [Nocardia sp. alder85J]|uniref:CaiB/BaiF CoA transferase family protein n=1 Tax=Nocardia sp. alder85J TaxID=2862949 RepID=UPI001CD31CCE|nr:CoA transferase [Nocardia sp. alder85J]MCX4098460.1 CoA transferase [Nocardia sp. alder85J]